MYTVTSVQPGTSVVFVNQPQIRSENSKLVPEYLKDGLQIRNWRVSINQIILCLTCGLMFFLIGIFLIGRGTTKQGFWPSDPNASLLDIAFGSTLSVLGGLMVVAFFGMCCYARNKRYALKENGVQNASAHQNPVFPATAPNYHHHDMP